MQFDNESLVTNLSRFCCEMSVWPGEEFFIQEFSCYSQTLGQCFIVDSLTISAEIQRIYLNVFFQSIV